MHTTDAHHRFLELRAQGWSLARIAGELRIAKRTLVEWNRDAQREIADLQSVEREALLERILVSHEEELQRLTAHLNRIEGVLAKRNLDCLSTESLFILAATVRAQLRRLSTVPGFAPASPSTERRSPTRRDPMSSSLPRNRDRDLNRNPVPSPAVPAHLLGTKTAPFLHQKGGAVPVLVVGQVSRVPGVLHSTFNHELSTCSRS